jgi:tetratricopeptide (TPR) repeat protein
MADPPGPSSLAAARAEAERALADNPADAGLLQFLGLVCCQMGDLPAGAAYLRTCLGLAPGNFAARIALAKAAIALGDLEEAEALCAAPSGDDVELSRLRGYIHQSRGKLAQAAACYAEVVAREPGDFEAWNNLGNARRQLGDLGAAIEALTRAAKLRPDIAMIGLNLGGALADAGRLEESLRAFEKAARLDPDNPVCLLELSRALSRLGRAADALEPLLRASRLSPRNPEIEVEAGLAHAALDGLAAAETAYRRALAIEPGFAPAYVHLATLFESSNRPDDLAALLGEAEVADVSGEEIAFVRALHARRAGKLEEALAFAKAAPATIEPHRKAQLIGELYDRLGDADAAFSAFAEMNRRLADTPGDPRAGAARYRRELEALIALTTGEWYAGWTPAPPPGRAPPVFLVGFPRSGTTLLDTVLMGHPGVQVIEEKPLLRPVNEMVGDPRRLAALDGAEVDALRGLYFEALDRHAAAAPARLAIDKMPLNISHAALIHRLFPEAKFIFAERHPCDVVLSCFITNFSLNYAMANFLDLGDAARLYDLVMTYWDKCRRLFALTVHEVRYERLVADLEGEVRPLLGFLDLPWEESVLDHQRTARGRGYVSTASYAQVTEPIYGRARGRWHRYRHRMSGVLPILAPWAERLGYDM